MREIAATRTSRAVRVASLLLIVGAMGASCAMQSLPAQHTEPGDPALVEVTDVGTCAGGGCAFACPPHERCVFSCSGGGCFQLCTEGSECRMTCTGGGCRQRCEAGTQCHAACDGGGCTQRCEQRFGCDMSCDGGRCR